MTTYYKEINENGKLVMLLTYEFEPKIMNPLVIKITQEEYVKLLAEIHEKAALVDKLYAGEITINDVPEELREEIQIRVDERISIEGEYDNSNISSDEFLNMLEEVL